MRSQQVRGLNLVYGLVESEVLTCSNNSTARQNIAIVGGGFSGLTIAAALIKKEVNAKITIFEQRDTLLPLQQGSNSRWLHPHIYDWPGEGSEAATAMLPVHNWLAARASDVVVQVLSQWRKTADQKSDLCLFCNTRHLQIHELSSRPEALMIEWVGEERNAVDGRTKEPWHAVGSSESFDVVILAVGFGLERDGASSYWRNETLGQPSLNQPRCSYIISGQGDGAIIDLLRLRVSQFRQDRILDELFTGRESLLRAVKALHTKYETDSGKLGLFEDLETLGAKSTPCREEFEKCLEELSRRLRRDTEAVLHLKVRKFAELFDPNNTRISFQNRVLVYLLYKCGGFFPSSLEIPELQREYAISRDRTICRHGTLRDEQLKQFLSPPLFDVMKGGFSSVGAQTDQIKWSGGFLTTPAHQLAPSGSTI